MKLKRTLALLFISWSLAGCSTTGTPSGMVWYQPGKSDADTQRDLAACRLDAEHNSNPLAMANAGFFILNQSNESNMIKDGMIARGYTLVKSNSVPSSVTSTNK